MRSPSLTSRLFRGLVGPMAGLALLLGIGGAWAIQSIVEAVNDRLLGASARAVAETLAVEEGDITLDLPPWALGMLANSARDNVYYNVFAGDRLITGYPDLRPPQTTGLASDRAMFRYQDYRGQRVRVAMETRRLPRVSELVVVQVAETLEARSALSRRMLLELALLEITLLVLTAILVPTGVRWGIAPLTRLRKEMDARSAADFTPLPVSEVPRELRDLIMAFNSLLARLDSAVEGMRRFTANASHQMRTPLSILRTHVKALKMSQIESTEALASIADIDAATDRLQRLLIQLLALARAEGAEPSGLALQDIDVTATARAVAEEHASSALRSEVQLRFIADDAHPLFVRGDAVLLAELIGNLLDNAIRYNQPGGSVTIRVVGDGAHVIVEVEDDGPGIPRVEWDKVFTRFYRLVRDQSRPGSGLGLSIVHVLAQTLGAEVLLAEGAEGKGLRVSVKLNRARQIGDRIDV